MLYMSLIEESTLEQEESQTKPYEISYEKAWKVSEKISQGLMSRTNNEIEVTMLHEAESILQKGVVETLHVLGVCTKVEPFAWLEGGYRIDYALKWLVELTNGVGEVQVIVDNVDDIKHGDIMLLTLGGAKPHRTPDELRAKYQSPFENRDKAEDNVLYAKKMVKMGNLHEIK